MMDHCLQVYLPSPLLHSSQAAALQQASRKRPIRREQTSRGQDVQTASLRQISLIGPRPANLLTLVSPSNDRLTGSRFPQDTPVTCVRLKLDSEYLEHSHL